MRIPQRRQGIHDFAEQRPVGSLFAQAAIFQACEHGHAALRGLLCIASIDQFFEQATKGSHLNALECGGQRLIVGCIKRCRAKIAHQRVALAAMEDVVGVQVAMHDALLMQMRSCRCNSMRNT